MSWVYAFLKPLKIWAYLRGDQRKNAEKLPIGFLAFFLCFEAHLVYKHTQKLDFLIRNARLYSRIYGICFENLRSKFPFWFSLESSIQNR